MREPGTWWRGKSTPAKIETYTRWSFHFFAVIEFLTAGLPAVGELGPRLGGLLLLMVGVHAVLSAVTASRALDWTRGTRARPVRLIWAFTAVTAGFAVTALAVSAAAPDREDVRSAAGSVFAVVVIFGAGILSLAERDRRRVLAVVGGFSVGAGLVSLALGAPVTTALVIALVILLGASFLSFTSVFSVWLLDAVYELDAARETRARLAVAEERLRFGRDLHDVLGRNLAVIALKSELAVQLARRERPEAVEQMIEVQRIAQESQREVRDVVRGYREVDLGAELAGAQGVLTAAGIACEVTGEVSGLPGEVQSALGWVVREATTNVLRHGDAGRCAVGLRVREGNVVLTVENDGVLDTAADRADGPGRDSASAAVSRGGGSGLTGLRERLTAVGGTLAAGPVGGGVFRLVAEVPCAVAGSGAAS
ncbi:histidine kinase [Streptomyces sp. AS58]|uniref:Two-component sensor histidine kinase n=1 Tax=Streptomyces cadmiisoli TaxID=2184053 RepID=A0A2Z4JBT3_9ACTN|nr:MULTISPECIES: histidine kinase [Streptomyces]AWW42559.1 two-component sensor histidine kinase [Streptomyces cadmiisoli]KOV51400.1 histidine kinase [Streptomyces sp. AS58]